MQRVISNIFKEFDMFAAPATLRAKKQPETRSICAGVLSFIIAGLFLYVFVINFIGVLNFTQIDSKQLQSRVSANETESGVINFAIGIGYESILEYERYFELDVVSIQNNKSFPIELTNCTEDQWVILGEDYKTIYSEAYLNDYYCPDSDSDKDLNISGSVLITSSNYNAINIKLKTCSNLTYCESMQKQRRFIEQMIAEDKYIIFWLILLDTGFTSDEKNPTQKFINEETRLTFTLKRGSQALIQYASYQVTTDVSILPFEKDKVQTGIYVDSIRSGVYEVEFGQQQYIDITISMNMNKKIVTRKVGKLDEMLSYAGGLFSIIIGFLSIFMMSYNQYRYELMVAEGAFNYNEEGKKIKEDDFGFLLYIQYSIYDWISSLFFMHLNWKECEEVDETREEARSQMDVTHLFRKIQHLEACLLFLMNADEKKCLTLIQPPSIQRVRNNRLISEYYDSVIGGNAAVTIEDIEMAHNILNAGLVLTNTQIEVSSRQNIIEVALENFPQIAKSAEEVQLSEQLVEVQKQLAESFYRMPQASRSRIQQKIPIKIIHRLRSRMNAINSMNSYEIMIS